MHALFVTSGCPQYLKDIDPAGTNFCTKIYSPFSLVLSCGISTLAVDPFE